MQPVINPYESPALMHEPEVPAEEAALRARVWRRLVAPATAFIVLGGGQAVAIAWLIVTRHQSMEGPTTLPLLGLSFILDVVIAVAGFRLLQLKSSQIGFTAAILCSIPALSPVFVAGIPFGVWMIVVLMLPSTCRVLDEDEVEPLAEVNGEMTTQSVNPYESPQGIELARPEPPQDKLLAALRGPSLGLIVLAGLQAFNLIVSLPLLMFMVVAGEKGFLEQALIGLISLPSVFILFAAIRMRQMRSLQLCRIGAILACIPFLSPSVILGIPFGIWATIVLFRQDTAALFDQPPAEN